MSDSKRARLPRKAAAPVSYTENAGALTESDDDDGAARLERERAAERKKAGKGKKKEGKTPQPAKPKEPEDAYLWRPVPLGIFSGGMKGQPAAYTPKRVDLTAMLPSEILLEICSHMRPITLWRMLFLNKRMYALLTSNSGLAIWHAAIDDVADEYSGGRHTLAVKRRSGLASLPLDGGRPVSLIKIAGLLFASDCQACGSDGVNIQLRLRLRLCEPCQTARFISLSDMRKHAEFEYLHPSTIDLVQTEDHVAGQPWAKRPFALLSEIQHVHEQLEDLQMQDDAAARSSTAHTSTESRRRSGSARSSTESGSNQPTSLGQAESLVVSYSRQREAKLNEELQIAEWISERRGRTHNKAQKNDEDHEGSEYRKDVRALRYEALLAQIKADTPFHSFLPEMIPDWRRHPDVSRSHPLSEEEWQAIKPRLCASIGRCIAHNIMVHHGLPPIPKSRVKLDLVMQQISEQPKTLDDAGTRRHSAVLTPAHSMLMSVSTIWTFVRPQIDVLLEDMKAEVLEQDAKHAERAAESNRLAKIRFKQAFFRARLDEMRATQQNEAAQTTLPMLIDFVTLPTVCSLYDDAEFAVDERQNERDLTTWRQYVDAIDEEVDDYRVHVRLQALQETLAATTKKSAEEIETIDADALLDPAFDESFFARPSSWLSCTTCEVNNGGWYPDGFGPIDSVLRHRHERHAWLSLPEPVGLQKQTSPAPTVPQPGIQLGSAISPVRLPLEFACVLLSICELGNLDPNDPTLSPNDLEETFEEWRLVWRNAELGKTSRHKCGELIRSVLRDARTAERNGKVLPVPDIARRSLNWRERRDLNNARYLKGLRLADDLANSLGHLDSDGDQDDVVDDAALGQESVDAGNDDAEIVNEEEEAALEEAEEEEEDGNSSE